MKERGIIMSAPMVKALLDGSKTQTRRIAQAELISAAVSLGEANEPPGDPKYWAHICPYGVAGDRLYVRETHVVRGTNVKQILYRADCKNWENDHIRWKPSIHMPRWASRITLEIKGVRVERLQDISEPDTKAEGICCQDCSFPPSLQPTENCTCVHKYARLWDSLHGKGAWELNQWVWVLEFKQV